MSLSFAKNHGALYRYYRCVRSQKEGAQTCPIPAVPAGDLETAVMEQIRSVLQDPRIMAAASRALVEHDQVDDPAVNHRTLMEACRDIDSVWSELYPAEQSRILDQITARIVVGVEGIDLHLRLCGLGRISHEAGKESTYLTNVESETQIIHLPLMARRRSGRTRLLAPSIESTPEAAGPDPLVIAIARAYRWMDELESGSISSVSALAAREKVDEAFVRRQLRMAMITPYLIRDIIDGSEPADLSVSGLTKKRLPDSWIEQKAVLKTRTSNATP